MNLQNHWFNTDDFRMALVPKWFPDFWDYPRNHTYRLLEAMVRNNRLSRLSVFVGPPGSGKTASAYLLGCASSCDHYDRIMHAPCGQCNVCQSVRLGKDSVSRGALIEIDGADRSGSCRPIDAVYEARNKTAAHRSSKDGDPNWNYIVFIDEAQRFTGSDREALLKLTERWPGAHIILATTDIERLAIPNSSDCRNPLLSRATVFHFDYPNQTECIKGLLTAAKGAGLELTEPVASWIAKRNGCAPRECLGDLYVLSNFGPVINEDAVDLAFGTDTQNRISSGATDHPTEAQGDTPVIY